MSKVRLELTPDELHSLSLLGQTKRGTLTKVPKALLNKLLVDHGRLVRYVKEAGQLEGHT
jgi:hypothetical protein